jgi:2-dehydro-3-deoxygluconokinase
MASSGMSIEVLTLGEVMIGLVASPPGPLAEARTFQPYEAGAEANVAVGLARLGHGVAYVGRVGDDGFGTAVVRRLRGEGVDVTGLRVDPDACTAVFVRERRLVGTTNLLYYRAGSAGSRLMPSDLDAAVDRFAAGAWLHVTGITPALSGSCQEAIDTAIQRAAVAGMTISFDINLRRKLWSEAEAAPVLRAITARSDVVFASPDEASVVLGSAVRSASEAAERLLELGPSSVVIKRGRDGALARERDGASVSHEGFAVPLVVDPVGAGDAFVAGFIAARLEGLDLATALAWGNAAGAAVAATIGDMTGLPTRPELEAILGGGPKVRR